jgi:hypothetical protein
MDPRTVAAQFAAFVWFTDRSPAGEAPAPEASAFARENWAAFLPCAHEGLGRLLLHLARGRGGRRSGRRPALAAAARGGQTW